MAKTWYDENSHRVTLSELKDSDGAYVNDAVVEAVMQDEDGAELGGIIWPVSMPNTLDGTGTYEADLSKDLEVQPQDRIVMIITATKGAAVGQWTCKVNVKTRGC